MPLTGKRFVMDAAWLGRIRAKAAALVFFISLKVTFKPLNVGITFKRQNMGGQTVKEPAVMGDNHGATGKLGQCIFKRTQGIHVQIVGRFVKQDHVAFLPEHLGQMHAVTLTTRKDTNFFLLVGPFEVESPHIARDGTARLPR